MMKNNLHRFISTLCFCLCIWGSAIAQNTTIHGKVTSLNKPEGIAGVSVMVAGTKNGTVTDDWGKYSITNVPKNAKLVFSSVGFKSQTIVVNNQTSINVELETDASSLDQVVVIGYGTTRKKDLTGAIASVKATQLENEHPAAVQDLLRANVPGLNIGFSTSPKGDASLQVRGKNTLNANSSPL